MTSSVKCGKCNRILLEDAEHELMFYCKGKGNVHIAVKPEREVFIRKRDELEFGNLADKKADGQRTPKKAKKVFSPSEHVQCKKCRAVIGAVGPWGPGDQSINQSIVTFGRDMVSICGVPPVRKSHNKKAPKLCDFFETQAEWNAIERRDDDNFLPLSLESNDSGGTNSKLYTPLVPDIPLVLPKCKSSWLTRNLAVDSNKVLLNEMLHLFGWYSVIEDNDVSMIETSAKNSSPELCCIIQTIPRDYQVRAYLESLLRNMIVVIPTGAGKTLVAALVAKKMNQLNPKHMALFVVDRVPLVFQQGYYLERETGLRVCKLCGENKRNRILGELNQSKFDVLVVTAGCLLGMIEKGQLDLRLFCNIIFDECHHASGEHHFMKVLREIENVGLLSTSGPRILGLTASPVAANTPVAGKKKLNNLISSFGEAGILYPFMQKNPTKVKWEVICRSSQQRQFSIWALGELVKLLQALNENAHLKNEYTGSEKLADSTHEDKSKTKEPLISMDLLDNFLSVDDLDRILNPASVGRLRGQIRTIGYYFEDLAKETSLVFIRSTKLCVNMAAMLLVALEASEVMGVLFSHKILKKILECLDSSNKADQPLAGDWCEQESCSILDEVITSFAVSCQARLDSYNDVDLELSPRLEALCRHLQNTPLLRSSDNSASSRALVLVNTREVARSLTDFLRQEKVINSALNPQMVVGHSGFDGMSWFGEQERIIEMFRTGSSRLLVATSVLEEGLDVPVCDLVVQLQGSRSLISFIQSRGRARSKNSAMVVIVSKEEHIRLGSIREQEVQMKIMVQNAGKGCGLPSESALRMSTILGSQSNCVGFGKTQRSYSALTRSCKESSVEFVFQIWVVFGACDKKDENITPPENSFPLHGRNIGQDELEREINCLLLRFDLDDTIVLSQVTEMMHTESMARIFDKGDCKGFMASFTTGSVTERTSSHEADYVVLYEAFHCFCKYWNFRLSSDEQSICWVNNKINDEDLAVRSMSTHQGIIAQDGSIRFERNLVSRVSIGRWSDKNVFSERDRIIGSELTYVEFLKKEGIHVSFNAEDRLIVPQSIMSFFALVDTEENECRLFIPLQSAPSFVTILSDGKTTKRLTEGNSTCHHIQPFSTNTVICIAFHEVNDVVARGNNMIHLLKSLECNYLATTIFHTLVEVYDETHFAQSFQESVGYLPSEQAFLTDVDKAVSGRTFVDGHYCLLPVFSAENIGFVRDVHWLVLCLFSQRLGCFTDTARQCLWDLVASIIKDVWGPIRIAVDMTPSRPNNHISIKDPKEASWIIIALEDLCEGVPYWCDVVRRFISTYKTMQKLSLIDNDSLGPAQSRRLNTRENRFKLYRAVITPSRVIYLPPIPSKGSRLFRKLGSERFVSIIFRDEQQQRLRGEEVIHLVKQRIVHPVTLAGRKAVFFGGSSSQLRDQRLLFVDVDILPVFRPSPKTSDHKTGDQEFELRLRTLRENIISKESLRDCSSPSKYLSRLALFCTADTPTATLHDKDVIQIADVSCCRTESLLTDGNGFIGKSLASIVSHRYLGLEIVPAAMQVRWRGVKGVVTVVPDDFPTLQGHKMAARRSMVKCQTGDTNDGELCIIDYSRCLPMFLNQEIINLLTSIKNVTDDISTTLHKRLDEFLKKAGQLFCDQDVACKAIREDLALFSNMHGNDFVARNFSFDDPQWVDILQARYRFLTRDLMNKARIPVFQGCQLIGIADPLGILKDGEVFVKIVKSRDLDDCILDEKNVMVFRNPCLHPGDVRLVRAVDYPELHTWYNVVVFPCNNNIMQNIPAECSGGDLDGDKFYVCWDQELVPPKHLECAPCAYHELQEACLGEESNLGLQTGCTQETLSTFVAKYFASDSLGKIATMHLAVSDLKDAGAQDQLAIEVAKAQSLAVDYPKTGISPQVPKEAKNLIFKCGLPDFMDNSNWHQYASRKPLGYLYRRAATFDFNYIPVTSYSLQLGPTDSKIDCHMNPLYILPGREKYLTTAKDVYFRYLANIRRLMVTFGIKSDAEAMLGQALNWHPMIHDHGKASQIVKESVHAYLLEVRDGFLNACRNVNIDCLKEKAVVASAFYEVAYRDGRARSFSLAVLDTLSKNVSVCQKNRSCATTISNRRIGTLVQDYCKEQALRIQQWSHSKLSVCEEIKHCLSRETGITNIIPFGSVSQGLCSQDSDLDLYVQTQDLSKLHLFPKSEEHILSPHEVECQILKIKVLPGLTRLVDDAQELFSPSIPILRCVLPSPIDIDMDHINIDLCCNFSGVQKSIWLQCVFLEEPSLYILFMLLQMWAREARVIRNTKVRPSLQPELRAESERPLMSTGEFHALILLTLQRQTMDVTERCKAKLESWDGTENLDVIELCRVARPEQVGMFVLSFFENIKYLASLSKIEVQYVWPVATASLRGRSHTSNIPMASIKRIAFLCEPACHNLLVTGSLSSFLDFAAGDSKVVHFSQKLSLSLSFRIDRACDFHAARLGTQFNCTVNIVRIGSRGQLILSAEGSRWCISRLKNEIVSYNRTSSWQFRASALAHRYMMEGSSDIRVLGTRSPDPQLEFKDIIPGGNDATFTFVHRFQKGLNQVSLCRAINPEVLPFRLDESSTVSSTSSHLTPTELGVAQSLEKILLQQISKLPKEFLDNGLSHDVRLRVCFGHFVVINVTQSLPESQRTLSLQELLKCMQKCGNQRKSWQRQDPVHHSERQSGKKEALKLSHLGQPISKPKKKRVKRSTRPGIQSTFIPTFDGDADKIATKIESALHSIGYLPTAAREDARALKNSQGSPVNYTLSLLASKGYEVIADFEEKNQVVEVPSLASDMKIAKRVYERPLSWVHFTLLGDGILPDMRVRLETTVPISLELTKKAFAGLCDVDTQSCYPASPIFWKQHEPESMGKTSESKQNSVPEFLASISNEHRRKILHIRQHLERSYYERKSRHKSDCVPFTARISRVREFQRYEGLIRLDRPLEKTEVCLEFNLTNNHMQANSMKHLALQILIESLELSRSLCRAGMKVDF